MALNNMAGLLEKRRNALVDFCIGKLGSRRISTSTAS